jgi:hypothetical protein
MERMKEIEQLRTQALPEIERIEFAVFEDFLQQGIEEVGWPIEILGSVAISFRYGTSAKAHSHDTGTPVLRMGNIKDGYLDYSDLKYIELQKEELDRYRLRSGDILINRTKTMRYQRDKPTMSPQSGQFRNVPCVLVTTSEADSATETLPTPLTWIVAPSIDGSTCKTAFAEIRKCFPLFGSVTTMAGLLLPICSVLLWRIR